VRYSVELDPRNPLSEIMVVWTREKPPQLSVVKPVYRDEMRALDDARVLGNDSPRGETAVILDSNVLGPAQAS
jgi:hypothetical protein